MKATKAITWNQLPSKPHHVLRISPPKNTKNVLHQQSTTKTIFYQQSSSIFQTNQYTTQIQRGIKGSDAQLSQKELLLNFSVQLKRYVDQKDYVKAERTWQEMSAKQLPATTLNFSLIIEAFGKQGKWEDMFRTFRELKEHNLFPTTRMLNVMLNSLGKGGLMKELFEIYDAIKNGQLGPSVKPDIITLNSILHYLVKTGDVERMAQVFKEMHHLDVKPSLPTYALLLDGFRTAKDIDTMVEIWKVMKSENIKPSILVHNYMIEGFAVAGRIDEMEQQVRAMREDSITPDLYTYNSLLLGYSSAGQEGTMLEIFRVLKAEGFQPDQNSYVPILRYYSEINPNLEKLTFYQQLMESEHIPHSPTTLNPLLVMHAKKGNLALLDQYFVTIQSQVSSLAPVFSLILHNAAKAGQMRVLGAYYNKMVDLGMPTDIRIYNCLIHGYGKKGFAETMWYYFQKMLESGVEPNNVTYNLLIQGFGISSKEFTRAWEIYESLVSNNAHNVQPDAFTFQLAISVAFRENNLDKIPKVLQDMIKFEIPITERTESSLVQGFSKAGKFQEAAEALLRMRSQGMTWDKDVVVFLQHLLPEWTERKQELLAVLDRMTTEQSMTEREAAWFSSFLSDKIISGK